MPKSIIVTKKNNLGLEIGQQTVLNDVAIEAVKAKVAHYSDEMPLPSKEDKES